MAKKKKTDNTEKTTVYLSLKNKDNLKLASFLNGESFTTIVNELLTEPLEKLVAKLQDEKNVKIVKSTEIKTKEE